ncbi:hypothetical protein BG000_011118 [Podila horticola]|nr:hypothetical protein BG000_011118 [Podila horticola]
MVLLRTTTAASLLLVLYLMDAVASVPFGFGSGSPDCPPDRTMNEQKIADPYDCTKYSKCSTWFSAKFSCKPGEHFNAIEGKCMSPWKAGCDPAYDCCKSSDDNCKPEPECEQM